MERDDDARKEISKTELPWDPDAINYRLQQLTNSRWLAQWRRQGEAVYRPPLIDEIDQTGVDRHRIATLISPETLIKIEATTRQERASLCTRATPDTSTTVFSFQHLLIQRLQRMVLEADAGSPAVPSCANEPQWVVGDAVQYCGEAYTVASINRHKISLESAQHGGFDLYLNGPDIAKLRPALTTKPVQDAQG